ncbi:MAG: hypothetical protein HYZ57_02245, partial [Acidobacteria bacterium]|nr:hypothetical protein [Acidobacteriota bacterium]
DAAGIGFDALVEKEPKARGYLRPREGYRLFEQRRQLMDRLLEALRDQKDWLLESLLYPVAMLTR